MRTGSLQEWEKFKRSLSSEQLKALEGNSPLEIAVREEDYIRAQEISVKLIFGESDYLPSFKKLMDSLDL